MQEPAAAEQGSGGVSLQAMSLWVWNQWLGQARFAMEAAGPVNVDSESGRDPALLGCEGDQKICASEQVRH